MPGYWMVSFGQISWRKKDEIKRKGLEEITMEEVPIE